MMISSWLKWFILRLGEGKWVFVSVYGSKSRKGKQITNQDGIVKKKCNNKKNSHIGGVKMEWKNVCNEIIGQKNTFKMCMVE